MPETMTPAGALLWLAGLEKPCNSCNGSLAGTGPDGLCTHCGGTDKVPVLDLREPCPTWHPLTICHGPACEHCHGIGWVPRQGETALHQAMNKVGFDVAVIQTRHGERRVFFWDSRYRVLTQLISIWEEGDANDRLAAVKAMKAAGYG